VGEIGSLFWLGLEGEGKEKERKIEERRGNKKEK
jgi:hypothetical protein